MNLKLERPWQYFCAAGLLLLATASLPLESGLVPALANLDSVASETCLKTGSENRSEGPPRSPTALRRGNRCEDCASVPAVSLQVEWTPFCPCSFPISLAGFSYAAAHAKRNGVGAPLRC